MMRGENIVCFAKDWSEDPTSNNHVMRVLARDNTVLWLNSISTRRPRLGSSSDVRKIGRKLAGFVRGPVRVERGLWVYTPIVLPFPHSGAAARVNERILRASIDVLRRRRGMDDFQLWTFLPTAARYAGKLGESILVYYCTDEWSQFDSVDGVRMAALERELCKKADLVFATSRTLLERRRAWNPETHLASHGVDHAHFAAALGEHTPVPADMRGRPRPVVGFFGLVESWIDIDVFAYLAEQRPGWTIVVVGRTKVDVSRLERYPNIILTGHRPYAELPGYCKAWDLALCPFVVNELTRNVNPIKLREYLSAGLPVVSTPIPEMRAYPEWCTVADGLAAFLDACERALAEDSPARRWARSDAMKAETWEAKVADLGAHVMRIKGSHRQG